MDWRNIARPVIIIALAVCLVLFGVYKVKETYTGFMQEYEGTYSAGGGEKIEVTIPEDTSVKEASWPSPTPRKSTCWLPGWSA